MRLGILGRPQSGKAAVFEALTCSGAADGYRQENRIGTITVPDEHRSKKPWNRRLPCAGFPTSPRPSFLRGFALLSAKPMLILLNSADEDDMLPDTVILDRLFDHCRVINIKGHSCRLRGHTVSKSAFATAGSSGSEAEDGKQEV